MKNALFIAILAFVVSLLDLYAQEQNEIDKTLENISGQYAECASYYELVYHAMNSSNEKEVANTYKDLANNAMSYSLMLAKEKRTEDMAVKVTNSRIEMYKNKMKQEADNRNENISILINNYHFDCKKLMENPPKEVNEIFKTKLKNASK